MVIFLSNVLASYNSKFIFARGSHYIVGFFPISINNSYMDKNVLQMALTVQSKLTHEYQQRGWGYVIFDTKRNNQDLIKCLLELQLSETFRSNLSCCSEDNVLSKIKAVVGTMSLKLALEVKSYLYPYDIDIFIKVKGTEEELNPVNYTPISNIHPLNDVNYVDLIHFLIKYYNWHKIVVITQGQQEMDKLWTGLKNTCSYHTYISPKRIYNFYNKMTFEKVSQYISKRGNIDAIILWTTYVKDMVYLFKRLNKRVTIVTGFENYEWLAAKINNKYRIIPIQGLVMSNDVYALKDLQRATRNNIWTKKFWKVKNISYDENYFNVDFTYFKAVEQIVKKDTEDYKSTLDFIYNKYMVNSESVKLFPGRCVTVGCRPGFYQTWKELYWYNDTFKRIRKPICTKCAMNYVKTRHGVTPCKICPDNTKSNDNRTKCFVRNKIFVEYSSTTAIIMYVFIVASSCLTIFILTVFVKFRNTPIVKSSVPNLSFIQIVAHCLLNIVLIALLGEPSNLKCKFTAFTVGFLYTIIMSCIFAKAFKLLKIFQSVHKMSHTEIVVTQFVQYVIIVILTMGQMFISIVSFILNSNDVIYANNDINFTVSSNCSKLSFAGQFIYTLLLSASCLIQAFRARKLPVNYNETKCIVFAMISNIIIILTFLIALPVTNAYDSHRIVFFNFPDDIWFQHYNYFYSLWLQNVDHTFPSE